MTFEKLSRRKKEEKMTVTCLNKNFKKGASSLLGRKGNWEVRWQVGGLASN